MAATEDDLRRELREERERLAEAVDELRGELGAAADVGGKLRSRRRRDDAPARPARPRRRREGGTRPLPADRPRLALQLELVATMRDLDGLATAMPETTKDVSAEGRPSYSVNGKVYCWHREPRPDAVDETGARLDDVLVFRVDGQETKDLVLADPRGAFFTTPHWNGYPAVLMRIRDLKRLRKRELRDLVVDAWLTRAPKRVAKQWLAENEPEGGAGAPPSA